MTRRTMALALMLSVVVLTPAIALGGSASTASNSQTFQDSTGEDPAAPDITSTVISNDDAGNIVIQVNISNRPALTPDMLVLVYLDTDPAAGDAESLGADWAIDLESGGVGLFRWTGSDYVAAESQSSLTYSYGATGATIRINASDLGKAKELKFVVIAGSGIAIDASGNPDFTNFRADLSPDPGHGLFTYQVLTQLKLSVVAFTTSPKPAKAGRLFSVGLAATQSDTAGPVQAGTVTCVATIAGKRLPVKTRRVANGIASCIWSIPKTAKGKRLSGSITLVVQGVAASRNFSSRIA